MNLSEQIRQAREAKGLSQETLAEQLNLSRQAVSKWEMGTSSPSPENLEALSAVLEVEFTEKAELPAKGRRWLWTAAGVTVLLCLLSVLALVFMPAFSEPSGPAITAIRFFDETGAALQPNLGDGWNAFDVPEREAMPVIMVVSFRNGRRADVNAVSVFFTPSGTETFDQREQWSVQPVEDGLDYALFVMGLRRDVTGELEIRLECGGVEVSEFLNLTTVLP